MESHQRDHENYVATRVATRRTRALLDFDAMMTMSWASRKNDIITVCGGGGRLPPSGGSGQASLGQSSDPGQSQAARAKLRTLFLGRLSLRRMSTAGWAS